MVSRSSHNTSKYSSRKSRLKPLGAMVKVGHLGVDQDHVPGEGNGEHKRDQGERPDEQHGQCRGAASMGGGFIWIIGEGRKVPLGRV